jgi:zinc-finger of the FCS-type, C2-C2
MLGKRARQPMRRTTSMKDVSFDSSAVHVDASQPSDLTVARQRAAEARKYGGAGSDWLASRHVAGHRTRRNSADLLASTDSAPFLRACGLCKRSLGPGRDTYMYRYGSRSYALSPICDPKPFLWKSIAFYDADVCNHFYVDLSSWYNFFFFNWKSSRQFSSEI